MRYIYSLSDIDGPVYIYGTGMVARLLYQYLKRRNVIIINFLLSDCTEGRRFFGIPVIPVHKMRDKEQIIIATLSDLHQAIADKLNERFLHNYYAVSETFFYEMRKSLVSEKREKASLKLRYSEMRKLAGEEDQNPLIVTDHELFERKHARVISGTQFLCEEPVLDKGSPSGHPVSDVLYTGEPFSRFDKVYIFSIRWDLDWKSMVRKAFAYYENVVLSFRYKFVHLQGYSLIGEAKKSGMQVCRTKRFYRSQEEYFTEDVLFFFTKRKISAIEQDALCTGCGLCELNCPGDAITLVENKYGCKKAHVDRTRCIDCGKCLSFCPVYKVGVSGGVPVTYVYSGEDEIRKHSSSGGVFGTIAAKIIKDGGFVCGAAWKDKLQVEHLLIDDLSRLTELQMSKYIRSDIRQAMLQVRERLLKGQRGLFVGCPCQVAAMKEYLGTLADTVYFIDLICSEAPSGWFFEKYFHENTDLDMIKSISFREKADGWRPDTLVIHYTDRESEIRHMEDISQQAFHSRMMMDYGCEHCNYVNPSRIGDLSIGDAWGVPENSINCEDRYGTSIVLVNSEKGTQLVSILERNHTFFKRIPFAWTFKNRTVDCIHPHERRDRFYREILTQGFQKAFHNAQSNLYDIGLVGNWSYPNYGSELTYFALYHVLKDLGYTVLLIEWPENSPWKPYGCTQLFEIEPYENDEIAQPAENCFKMMNYNERCRMFLLGSDQLLNPDLYWAFGRSAILDWVHPEKKRIGYALSIGSAKVQYSESDRKKISYYLQKFDAVSVREESAVRQMEDLFHVEAKWVLDPVFLCNRNRYAALAENCTAKKTKGIFAYILDLNSEIQEKLQETAKELGEEIYMVTDAAKLEDFNEKEVISVEQWLFYLIHCKYFIADSFHGISFAMIFHKKFAAIKNENRGETRFDSILGMLDLRDRMLTSGEIHKVSDILKKGIDYKRIDQMIEKNKKDSIEWLVSALKAKHQNKYDESDFIFERHRQELEKMIADRMQE